MQNGQDHSLQTLKKLLLSIIKKRVQKFRVDLIVINAVIVIFTLAYLGFTYYSDAFEKIIFLVVPFDGICPAFFFVVIDSAAQQETVDVVCNVFYICRIGYLCKIAGETGSKLYFYCV